MMRIDRRDGMAYVSFACMEYKEVTAVVSCRIGGVSEGIFSSLNMKCMTGELPEHVAENRRRFLGLFDIDSLRTVGCEQVHGNRVAVVSESDCGKGAVSIDTAIPDCDGLVTDVSNVPLIMHFADCTPLLFYDPFTGVIGVAHGGWRGTVGNIGAVMVKKMEEYYGSRAENIRVAMGPAIGFDDFEVGAEVIEAFRELFSEERIRELSVKKENGKYLFNLPCANRFLLEREGIRAEHIEDCGISTYRHTDLFYSYRKEEGKTGRHMAVVMLK